MAQDELVSIELMLDRFRRLVSGLQAGAVTRNDLQPWEVEILLDIESFQLDAKRRAEILQQYQQAVERQMETGPGTPMKLSEFLILRGRRSERAI